ncbi:hypothetical protein [Arthrobacter sp. L77]|uniref:hypothetical protein n=1 Tax=Arthrobacter sp. L77 TaxID=1496689 RepID=UPI0018CE6A33|nr:hypothetical protein [Arthrobacter sp. L77]
MSIADAFAITGGGHAPWSMILYGMSLLSLVVLLMTPTKEDQVRRKANRIPFWRFDQETHLVGRAYGSR